MIDVLKKYFEIKKIITIYLGSLLLAIGINLFLVPSGLYSGGLTGILMILSTLSNGKISISFLYLVFNIPLLALSWFKLGKRFTFLTIFAVIFFSINATFIPIIDPISDDKLVMAIFSGVIIGCAVVLMIRSGGCGGGIDIISLYLSERTGKPMGVFVFITNSIVLLMIATIFDLEIVLYTLIALYITSVVVDKMYTRFKKLTVTVNTKNSEDFITEYQEKTGRGVTIIPAFGGYTGESRQLLYFIITSYELRVFVELVRKYDPNALINVNESTSVFGNFIQPKIDEL